MPDGRHISIYTWGYEGCNREFSRTGNILDHVRMHWKIKPHQWEQCQKSFTQKSNLKKHMKIHAKPKLEQRKQFKWWDWGSKYTEKYNYKVI